MKKIIKLLFIATIIFNGCEKEETLETTAPRKTKTIPAEGSTIKSTFDEIYVEFNEEVTLNNDYDITANGEAITATDTGKKIILDISLKDETEYEIYISASSVKDLAGNFAAATTFSFTCSSPKPKITKSQPANSSNNINISTEIYLEYSENVTLANDYNISINGVTKTAVASGNKVTIDSELLPGTNYSIIISETSVMNTEGFFAADTSITFRTKGLPGLPTEGKYEAEKAYFASNMKIASDLAGFSGSGYVGTFENSDNFISFEPFDIQEGYYNIYLSYSTSTGGASSCEVLINGLSETVNLNAYSGFNETNLGTKILKSSTNEIKIKQGSGQFIIDYIRLEKITPVYEAFNLDAELTTPTPSQEAINVYNFLKENFQEKIISGTMAKHSTNIEEATWIYNETGKWPALTGFDFIDHPNQGQTWVEYDAIFDLANDWWNNNGLVTIMWHWRDPLNKSGAFYTDETGFDVSKISEPNSAEYIAMLEDIDVISGYLKEFRDANIPVIWRPLHEAAGGWFWWGAKGAVPCVELWKIMYDRMVNYHNLNNLIWVWTTDTKSDALDWYPGHNYVDVLGMDIYPGENQHGSQYIEFNEVRELFGDKKIIALSECGSVPDPALMKEYGDTWSWFMPWNGDFTKSDKHNGSEWWNTFFSYDYVITRDDMPDLK